MVYLKFYKKNTQILAKILNYLIIKLYLMNSNFYYKLLLMFNRIFIIFKMIINLT